MNEAHSVYVYVLKLHAVFVCVTGSESVYVSKALQKAKIEVNEDGTKASAATSTLLCHMNPLF